MRIARLENNILPLARGEGREVERGVSGEGGREEGEECHNRF